jgi:hypothetical protein
MSDARVKTGNLGIELVLVLNIVEILLAGR